MAHQLASQNNQTQISKAKNVYELRNTGVLVKYLYKELFGPTEPALLKAIKKVHLVTWTGLTEDAINKNMKMTPATALGQMYKNR